jgi:hypothetical protein
MSPENKWGQAAEIGLGLASIYFLYKSLFAAHYIPNLPIRRIQANNEFDNKMFRFRSERDFALALSHLPYLTVIHEPGKICLSDAERRDPRSLEKQEVTFDFRVIDREIGAKVFVEVTYGKLKGNKTRQRAGVEVALVRGEKIPYVQIDGLGIRCLKEAQTADEIALVLHDLTGGILPAMPMRTAA